MPEVTDTNPNIFPEGPVKLTVSKVPLKKKTEKGNVFYEWDFEGMVEDQIKTLKVFYWPSEMKDLLLAVGGKEDPVKKGQITWEKEEVSGRKISATVYHIPQRKDPTRKDVKLKDIVEEPPF
jgi:hypothetical protein